MKKFSFILLVMVLIISNTYSQKDSTKAENPISISCDLMSRYVWRGADLGTAPSIQPGIEYNKSGFAIGVWGAYAINFQGYQESDFYLGYKFYKDMFSVLITDYYFQSDLASQNYFDYKKETTGHVLETTFSFNGTEKLPLSVMIAANVYGADAKKINDDGTVGNIQFSTYTELGYSLKYLNAFLGINLTKADTDRGESGYFGDEVGIINLGISTTKNIKITKSFTLPLTVSVITNPQAKKIYFVAGISL